MTRAMVPSLVNVAYGRDVSWEGVMRMGAVSVVGAIGANKVCGWYLGNQNSYWAHKVMHFGLGTGMGVLMDPEHRLGVGLSAGTAAMVAEILAESMIGSPIDLLKQSTHPEPISLAKERIFLSKAIGTIAGSLIAEDCDPQVSMMTAKNAVDNNAVFLLPLGGIALAELAAAGIISIELAEALSFGLICYNVYNMVEGSGNSTDGASSKPSSSSGSGGLGSSGSNIPPNQRLRKDDIVKNNTIDLERFSKPGTDGGKLDPKTNFELQRDWAGQRGHGGSYYKLYYNGKKAAVLDKFGRILRIYNGWK